MERSLSVNFLLAKLMSGRCLEGKIYVGLRYAAVPVLYSISVPRLSVRALYFSVGLLTRLSVGR